MSNSNKRLRFTVEMYEHSTDSDVAIHHVQTYDIDQQDGWQILQQLQQAENCLRIRQEARLVKSQACAMGIGIAANPCGTMQAGGTLRGL